MAFQIPAKVEAVFGSQTRAKVLGYLAVSSVPQTGYSISKNMDIGIAKVYESLRKLESCGVLVSSLDVRGSKRFLLNDGDLRNFLIKNLRILSADDWFLPARIAERRRNFKETRRINVNVPAFPARKGKRPFANEFRRPPEKDRALSRMRKAPSRRQ